MARIETPVDPSAPLSRRHDLDWLRVFAFSLLIFYHIGMFYVSWPWHVKSAHAPVEWIETPMRLLNGWRLPLLFFISGVSVRYALAKTPPGPFMRRRLPRLLGPIAFGMLVVCAPQTWFELSQAGLAPPDLATFYVGYVSPPWASPDAWPMITPTWNHLWYVVYVLAYTIVLAGVACSARAMRALDAAVAAAGRSPAIFFFLVVPAISAAHRLLTADSVGRAQTFWGDWHNLTGSFLVMTLGFAMARAEPLWAALSRLRWASLAVCVVLSALILVDGWRDDAPGWAYALVRLFQGFTSIWALLGFARLLLDRPSPALAYLSGAVFAYYILHKTIIIAVGAPLTRTGTPLWAEAGLIVA
ncbi:MAG: acyltransferase family protein, partial [Pseudomonadota bacterium]